MHIPKQKPMFYVVASAFFVTLCVQLYLAHMKLESIYSSAETGYAVGGVYGTSKVLPEEPDEEYRQFVWSRFEQDGPSVEGMSGHWALSCPTSSTSYSGFWKETNEPNTFELYDIVSRSQVGSMRLYFASKHADGRMWLEFNNEYMFLCEVKE